MKKVFANIWFSLPVQLLLLHFRKYQVFLILWYIMFATVGGGFMKSYGADTLFLAPEYYSQVNALSTAIVGYAVGIFIMSWNITTFILHGFSLSFLATTAQPFLKYCINNALLPLIFLLFYFIVGVRFSTHQELLGVWEIVWQTLGFAGGLFLSILVAFIYFFRADKTIFHSIEDTIKSANKLHDSIVEANSHTHLDASLKIKWFLSARFKIRSPRNVQHYDQRFLKKILGRHHFAAVLAILIAFIFLVIVGLFADEKFFQIPAASSIIIFFSILIAVAGAFSIFFKTWSLVFLLVLYLFVNFLYKKEVIDPRNKAYGLNYGNKEMRPVYSKESIAALASQKDMEEDKQYYLQILNNWKAKQRDSLPTMFIINTSGGGLRSATFTMNVLQRLDSLMDGQLLNRTLFITGASGGMLGAAYYRELFYKKQQDTSINIYKQQYVNDIAADLLNSVFSSFVARDIVGPVQKFKYNGFSYNKDRGYAFEEKLNENTHYLLNKSLKDYVQPEYKAQIPFLLMSTVISRDARKLIIASHPARFLMKPANSENLQGPDADIVDFASFFARQNAMDLRMLSALRMNATFPYALPNVWLPTNPIIDVMDAGIRDNYGTENTLRFMNVFKEWLQHNTAKIVILQIRDRSLSDWEKRSADEDYLSFLTKPFAQLQHNWFKLQDYYQAGQTSLAANEFDNKLYTLCWQYIPAKKNAEAGLSFHLNLAEKIDIAAVYNEANSKSFEKLKELK